MLNNVPPSKKNRRIFAILAGIVAACAIALLTSNVSREIRQLSTAQSDNVQWSLVQTQVEFLEFEKQLGHLPVDLELLRQKFDVFFSRVMTVQNATVFEDLRTNPASRDHLVEIVAFLNDSATIIDAPDAELIAQLPKLAEMAGDTATTVKSLGNSGLELFAREADDQRETVARTMSLLALALAALIGILLVTILFLNRLNGRIYRRERENKQTTERMATVMSTSLDGVVVCDADGKILEFSPAAEMIFGHNYEDVLGCDIGAVIVPDHLREAYDLGAERMRPTNEKLIVGKGRVTLQGKHSDGRIFPMEMAVQSATTDKGDIYVAFLRDISRRFAAETALVAARDQALASEKLKTDFLSTMSHEIRTPLNGVLGNMTLLRDTDLSPEQDRYIGYMETSGRLLMRHVSDVLDITRYDAGKLSLLSEPVNISELFQDIIDTQKSVAETNGTTLSWTWQGTRMDWILSDLDRLQNVMINLIGNAVKFTRNGDVAVTIENIGVPDAAELMVKIKDTGLGLPASLIDRVFDDFVTGNTAYDREVGGTGLGLSIAKRFVHALGGEIGVDSVEGQGSTFWVTLPVTPAQAPEKVEALPEVAPKQRPLKVLLVEDNEINRIVARGMLQAEGHTVVEAHDGEKGVEASKATRFDLILMDISMPIMDGRAATRAIRGQSGASQDTMIIALTANAMIEEQSEFLKDGMNGVLTKPLSRDALRDLLHEVASAAT